MLNNLFLKVNFMCINQVFDGIFVKTGHSKQPETADSWNSMGRWRVPGTKTDDNPRFGTSSSMKAERFRHTALGRKRGETRVENVCKNRL